MLGSIPRSMSAALLLVLLVGFVHAEEPTAVTAPTAADFPPAAGCPCAHGDGGTQFALDVLLGQQLGIRGQFAVNRNPDSAWVVEAFYGALLDKLGSGEGAGLGGRYYWRRTNRDGCNSVLFGPGVGMYYHFREEVWMLAPTADVAWVRAISDTGAFQLGLNLGVGIGVGDRESARVTPLISLITGFRF